MLEKLVNAYIIQNDNLDEALEDLSELTKKIRHNPYQVADKIDSIYKDIARENDYCPMCFVPLESKELKNEPCEYMGREVVEIITEKVCPLCGYIGD